MKFTFWSCLGGVLSISALMISEISARAEGTVPPKVGLQLYSLRNSFATNVPETMVKVSAMGIKYVELAGTYKQTPEDFKAALAAHRLVPISAHFDYDLLREHPEKVVAEAKALGVKYAGCAWIRHDGAFTEKNCRDAAAVFNKAGQLLAKENIRFFYHTHGYEFQPYEQGTLFDLLMKETDKKFVTFEMDIFWIVFPGQDPVALLKKYKGRFELMHLKDMDKGLKTGSLAGGTDQKNDVTLGTGQINVAAAIATGEKTGVKWYFIEDESPTAEQQIPQSLKYLETLKW